MPGRGRLGPRRFARVSFALVIGTGDGGGSQGGEGGGEHGAFKPFDPCVGGQLGLIPGAYLCLHSRLPVGAQDDPPTSRQMRRIVKTYLEKFRYFPENIDATALCVRLQSDTV